MEKKIVLPDKYDRILYNRHQGGRVLGSVVWGSDPCLTPGHCFLEICTQNSKHKRHIKSAFVWETTKYKTTLTIISICLSWNENSFISCISYAKKQK